MEFSKAKNRLFGVEPCRKLDVAHSQSFDVSKLKNTNNNTGKLFYIRVTMNLKIIRAVTGENVESTTRELRILQNMSH
jgi:hypothetical protein